MIKLISYSAVFCLVFALAGCVTKSREGKEGVVGEDVLKGTIGTVSATVDATRTVTENTGRITENVIKASSDAVKHVIISLEGLRRKSIETFGQREVTTEYTGPVYIPCPYCGKNVQVTKPPQTKENDKQTCPYCKQEFLINWVE